MEKFIKQRYEEFNFKKSGGFTLIETLVAISVFTMSVLTLIVILSQGITNINYAKQKMIAEYLAQEGVEYLKNVRDTNVISATTTSIGWSDFKTQTANCFNLNGCFFDDGILFEGNSTDTVKNIGFSVCVSGDCPTFKYDLGNYSNAKYNYTYGLDTSFKRKIILEQINTDEVRVISTVFWNQGSSSRSVSFSTVLYNWIE